MQTLPLSPAQQQAHDQVLAQLKRHPLVGLTTPYGYGRTTVLTQLARTLKGHLLRVADLFELIRGQDPLKIEEAIAETLLTALDAHAVVLVDDFYVIQDMVANCFYKARPTVLRPALDQVRRRLESGDRRLVLGMARPDVAAPLGDACLYARIPAFTPEDFAHLFGHIVGEPVAGVDFARVHRFVPKLNAYQIRYTALMLEDHPPLETEAFLDFLEAHALASNVNTEEVEAVSLDDLHGVDEVIRQLDVDIIVPMERPDLMDELGLKPKRGVLLYGPPGTGKTTIGRALAHRLRSKFFLIDGTVISGSDDFYRIIQRIFHQARENAPSIIFIDDCDLLFENEQDTGLYRYLLTMLDGLESKGNSQVAVMLTAMNIGSLPPALIRSGRVELWLEMKLPDTAARRAILTELMATCPAGLRGVDSSALAGATEGLTGADLKRVVADAVNLFGYDIAREQPRREATAYFEQAVGQLRHHREQMQAAPPFTAAHHGAASRSMQQSIMAAMRQFSNVGGGNEE